MKVTPRKVSRFWNGVFLLLLNTFGLSQGYIYVSTIDYILYKVNPHQCTATFIGYLPNDTRDIAVTPNGKLYCLNNQVFEIDTISTTYTNLSTTVLLYSNSLVDLDDTTLLLNSSSKLYSFNIKNGKQTLLGDLSYGPNGDFAWCDSSLFFVMQNSLVRTPMPLTGSLSPTIVYSNSNYPECFGLVTASSSANYDYLLGCSNTDIVKICPFDGSYSLQCPNIVPTKIGGMATRSLKPRRSLLTTCSDITDLQNRSLGTKSIRLVPNPSRGEAIVLAEQSFTDACFILYDVSGNEIQRKCSIQGPESKITESYLADGVYFLHVQENSETIFVGKLLVAH